MQKRDDKEGMPCGIRVNAVKPLSSADLAGIEAGDLIVAVEGEPIQSPADYLKSTKNRLGEVAMDILRGNQMIHVIVQFLPPKITSTSVLS